MVIRKDHMSFYKDMDTTGDQEMMGQVLNFADAFDFSEVTDAEVRRVLTLERLEPHDFAVLLSPAAAPHLETMAHKAQALTKKHFGTNVSLFTPLYLGNYCENHCTYCGFSCRNKIKRGMLDEAAMRQEYADIAATGLEDILLLTGESRAFTDVEYIGLAVRIAKEYFLQVGIEIYPLDTEEYRFLHECGADYVCVYQETYQPEVYEKIHLAGPKRSFPYRFNAQYRALTGGMRQVSFADLLGIGDFRKDALATGIHAELVQKQFPHGEIGVSCPRLRPYINETTYSEPKVTEAELLQVMLAYRIYLPYASLTISSRESARFRDHVVGLCATKISAGVKVSVGGHGEEARGDEQFEIDDDRDVTAICEMLKARGLQPVFNDYIYV